MAIATQEVYSHTDGLVEIWDAGEATPARTLLVKGGRPGVTLTDTVGVAKPDHVLYGAVKVTGITQPGVGNDAAPAIGTYATGVATDGTWEFEGVVSTGTTPAPTSTVQGTEVYLITATGELTLEKSTNTHIGWVNYTASYEKAAGVLPIKIGA